MRSSRILQATVLLVSGMVASGGTEAQAAFPGENGSIAFVGQFVEGGFWDDQPALYSLSSDAKRITRITSHYPSYPAFSPDGRTLATGPGSIYTMNPDGTGLRRLTDGFEDTQPAWSPDGSKIAFRSSRSGSWDIWVVNIDGSGLQNLTNTGHGDLDPAWSPDGKQIAFGTYREGDQEVFVMDSDGTDPRNVTNNPDEDDREPTWSPDGGHIAFASGPIDAGSDIFVTDRLGQTRIQLTEGPHSDYAPAWSPTGRRSPSYARERVTARTSSS